MYTITDYEKEYNKIYNGEYKDFYDIFFTIMDKEGFDFRGDLEFITQVRDLFHKVRHDRLK